MKIYTRSGDEGETSLFAGGRVSKSHLRLHAYGTVDELNAVLGLAAAAGVGGSVAVPLIRVQAELFTVGADLATPLDAQPKWLVRVTPEMTARLEAEIDAWQAALPELRNFILPGGALGGAFLHQARVVCRRAERWLVALSAQEALNDETLRYLNRLSDWLFVAARVANQDAGEPESPWQSPER
ncbi:MAG TPA: cob(I)yrinic acid a,c-diamide adenosyltransferase [Aggregatilineaceae bacterium]|nr:cob(I)yrinic acid a,c-diamide adenosyltransferase [Anaerolineae bacterium]HMM26934.1 cob(I)yrinic acid a,c-diamide adenosyltransferase [Aggregatilineaceae bacterium]